MDGRHYYAVTDFREFLEAAEVQAVDPNSSPDRVKRRPFVPTDKLTNHLSPNVLKQLLGFYKIDAIHCQEIRESYLILFTILFAINQAEDIVYFLQHKSKERLMNSRLPFGVHDVSYWPPECQFYFQRFYDAQWKFCAHTFVNHSLNQRLQEELILPITSRQVLNAGPDSCTYKIEIYPGYFLTPQNSGNTPATKPFVLKTCRTKDSSLHWNEVRAYQLIASEKDVLLNTVQIYGSWAQGQEYNILMEYVDGGTLEDFFQSCPPPVSEEDVILFWERLVDIMKPLSRIHKHPDPNNKYRYLEGIHNDIKPSNILVTKPEGCSRYNVNFKLADLGLCHFAPALQEGESRVRDTSGTQIFTAPEYYREEKNPFSRRDILEAKPSKDVWSMGCVLSEAAVWSVGGRDELERYREERAAATNRIPTLHKSASTGCFHDSERVLQEVREKHVWARVNCRRCDNVLHGMISVIEDMLEETPQRPETGKVHSRCQSILRIARSMSSTPRTPPSEPYPEIFQTPQLPPELPQDFDPCVFGLGFSPQVELPRISRSNRPPPIGTNLNGTHNLNGSHVPQQVQPPAHIPRLQSPGYPEQSLNSIASPRPLVSYTANVPGEPTSPNQIRNTVQHPTSTPLSPGRSKPKTISVKDVNQWIKGRKVNGVFERLPGSECLRALDNRDQIFIIDDSESMKTHRSPVKSTFGALAYLVKSKDPDGIELRYTSNPTLYTRSRDRTPLLRKLKNATFTGQWDIGLTLGRILGDMGPEGPKSLFSRLRLHQTKKYGVNIYVLTDGIWQGGDGWLDGIVEPIKKLVAQGMSKRRLGIQFIQFGTDPEGTRRLHILDNELRQHGVTQDFVDTEHWTGNVYKMLLGAFDPSWDGLTPNPATPRFSTFLGPA